MLLCVVRLLLLLERIVFTVSDGSAANIQQTKAVPRATAYQNTATTPAVKRRATQQPSNHNRSSNNSQTTTTVGLNLKWYRRYCTGTILERMAGEESVSILCKLEIAVSIQGCTCTPQLLSTEFGSVIRVRTCSSLGVWGCRQAYNNRGRKSNASATMVLSEQARRWW